MKRNMNFLRQGSGSNFFSKMVDVPLVAVNVILVICMVLASFSDRVRPTESLVVSELGLGFPVLLVLAVLAGKAEVELPYISVRHNIVVQLLC